MPREFMAKKFLIPYHRTRNSRSQMFRSEVWATPILQSAFFVTAVLTHIISNLTRHLLEKLFLVSRVDS